MVKKKDNTTIWIIGILVFLFVIIPTLFPDIEILPQFAIITETTCISGTVSEWELDGNILDTKGINNGLYHNGTFIDGKFGQAIRFDGTNESYMNLPSISGDRIMWIKNYTEEDNDYKFYAVINGETYVNVIQSSVSVPSIGPEFGKNDNISVDRIAVFDNLTVETIEILYASGDGKDICWQVEKEVNIT